MRFEVRAVVVCQHIKLTLVSRAYQEPSGRTIKIDTHLPSSTIHRGEHHGLLALTSYINLYLHLALLQCFLSLLSTSILENIPQTHPPWPI